MESNTLPLIPLDSSVDTAENQRKRVVQRSDISQISYQQDKNIFSALGLGIFFNQLSQLRDSVMAHDRTNAQEKFNKNVLKDEIPSFV